MQLVPGPALLDCLGRLGGDVDGADGLAVRIECRTGVLAFVTGPDRLDQEGHRAAHIIVKELVFVRLCREIKGSDWSKVDM